MRYIYIVVKTYYQSKFPRANIYMGGRSNAHMENFENSEKRFIKLNTYEIIPRDTIEVNDTLTGHRIRYIREILWAIHTTEGSYVLVE